MLKGDPVITTIPMTQKKNNPVLDLKTKKIFKERLLDIFGKKSRSRDFLLGIDLTDFTTSSTVSDKLELINALINFPDFQTVIITKRKEGQKLLSKLNLQKVIFQEDYTDQICLGGLDALLLFPHTHEPTSKILHCFQNGTIVITKNQLSDLVKEYLPLKEKGNGFLFKTEDQWEIFAAVIKAWENYQFPYDWENIQQKNWRISV
ncbi:hypothetical protein COT40_02010 [Candidatus Peregrinibacteria bacterium CG08_land_8_20_14_0_20_41_10]|nr:MAG: hypothetical protein COT40_02010 [Candidatus Peregrinibacteria bacterium CG08_land_8_20_14_0_20_41_10]